MPIDHALRDDLQKSEDRFATAFHANPLATVITSLADGRFIDCNDTYCRLTGYRREELLGTIASALPIWDSAAERQELIKHLLLQGSVHEMEVRYRTANGERRYALVSAETIEIGGEQCMLSFVQDITTRKQVEVMHAMQLAISRMLAQAPAYDSLMTSDLVQCFYKTCSCRRVEMWTTDANGLVLEAAWPRLSSHEQAIRTHAEHHHVHTTTGMVVTAFQTGQPISQHSTLSDVLPLFRDYPEALIASTTIADRCRFDLTYGLQDLPLFPLPAGMDAVRYLADLCCQALPHRYPRDADSARRQLAYELRVIDQANLCNYFLIVWDLVHFARSHGIRCQGRGSAANSLVAYLLHISPVDPLAHDLVFERFLSAERPSLPDIDIDFDAARREEVIGYVFGRYGHDHAAMACTFSTFGARRALCDTARVLGIPPDTVRELTSQLAETVSHHDERLLRDLCGGLAGLPRHLGQHSGGMVITRAPLSERVATEPAAMAGRTVVQWDKDAIEEAGLVKIDILGLRMLAVLSECEQLLAEHGTPITLDALTFDDPAVYAILCRADTMGVFQVESRAQAQILPRLKPACFNDIILAISLIRPGPLQGNMVHPFLRRRMGIEPVMYPHPRLQAALAETLGVILFQEQVLKVARDLAGFSAGEGEQLRRALGGKQGHGRIATLRARFIAGAQVNGVASSAAEAVFAQLEAFGGYSFPKSHAAAFAVIVYQSAWLKHYYPATFLCALLNNQPMGFWPPAVLVRDAQRHGVVVLPLDIHTSGQRCTLEQTPNNGTVRLGLNYVIGLGEQGAQRILAARHVWPFADLAAFCRRTRLPRSLVGQLIDAGAFDGWGERRVLHWQLGMLRYEVEELDLPIPTEAVDLPQQSEGERYEQEMASTGVALGPHPIARWRAALDRRGFASSATLASIPMGQRVEVVGVCIIHQAPPTAKGFHFLTLEDELGMINTIVQPQLAQELGRQSSQTLRVQGVVQHEGAVTNLVALTIERVETS